jgi:hypothetical protein
MEHSGGIGTDRGRDHRQARCLRFGENDWRAIAIGGKTEDVGPGESVIEFRGSRPHPVEHFDSGGNGNGGVGNEGQVGLAPQPLVHREQIVATFTGKVSANEEDARAGVRLQFAADFEETIRSAGMDNLDSLPGDAIVCDK